MAIRVKKDGTAADSTPPGKAVEVEANTEIDIDIGDVATVRVRGGRRDAQQRVESLETRWSGEVALHLAAANVVDLDGLSAKIAEAQELESSVKAKDTELEALRAQIAALVDSAQRLRQGVRPPNSLPCGARERTPRNASLRALNTRHRSHGTLRARRQRLSIEREQARATVGQAGMADTLAEERALGN